MRVALGLKAHSGWAALVAVGEERGVQCVLERQRIALIEDADAEWAGQPYHAADGKPVAKAQAIVARGIDEARRCARSALRAVQRRMQSAGHDVVACAVLVPAAMPDWSTEQILAVHFRMHKAEGALYPDALLHAARAIGLNANPREQKSLHSQASTALGFNDATIAARLAALGKSIGAPWGADQKSAALAALLVLSSGAPARSGVE